MEFCRHCGQGVMVQIQKNTGFCTPNCEEKYDTHRLCVGQGCEGEAVVEG